MTRRAALGAALSLILLAAPGCVGDGATGPVPGLPPTVLEVTPEVLSPGDTAVLHGLNFATRAAGNTVRVGSAEARVLEPAAETRLSIRLDDVAGAACAPTRPVDVSVTVDGRTGTSTHPLAPISPLRLPPGVDTAASGTGTVGCQNLPEGEDAAYLVSLFNRGTAAGRTVDFRIRGRTGGAGSTGDAGLRSAGRGAAGPGPGPRRVAGPGFRDGGDGLLAELVEGRVRESHALRRGRDVLRRRGPTPVPRSVDAVESADGTPPSPGDLVEFRVPDLSAVDACDAYHEITGRVVAVTSTAVVVEDTAAPLAETMDDAYRDLAEEYEAVMAPIVREHFGDPLVHDEQLDGDGHFYMVFSPRVNDLAALLAFVWGGDYLPRGSCGSSDTAEIFYGRVPTRRGGGESVSTLGGWERIMRPTTIHEVKHIVAFAAHRAGGAPRQEEHWLEEATAMVAEELYAREIFGFGHRENTTYGESLACELDPAGSGCGDAPLVMAAHFTFLRSYLRSVAARSPLGRGTAALGGGWWLLRWALDHATATEAAFLRALTRETGLFGVENLEARAGRSFASMLAEWSLALEADDRPDLPEGVDPRLTVPSWDVRSVFQGLHENRPGSFPNPFPLSPGARDYGDFLVSVTELPGGSASLLELTAASDRQQLLEVLGAGGGPPPADLGLSILRLR